MATFFNLKDDFEREGNDLDQCKADIEYMTAHTHHRTLSMDEIPYIASYDREYAKYIRSLPDEEYEKYQDKVPFNVLSKERLESMKKGGSAKTGLMKADDPKLPSSELFNETAEGNGLFIKLEDKLVPFSDLGFQSALDRAGISGIGMMEDDLLRNAILVDRLYHKRPNNNVHLVWRTDEDGNEKVFSFMGGRYCYIPQTTLLNILDKMGTPTGFNNPVMKWYYISHSITRLYIEYPDEEQEGVIPGIELRDSDCGFSSLAVYATIRVKGSRNYCIVARLEKVHAGSQEKRKPEDIAKEADDKIFPELRKIPEIMKELDTYVTGPLLAPKDKEVQKKKIAEIYKTVFREKNTGLSKKVRKELSDALIDEINPDREYTWKDLAGSLMSIPDRLIGADEKSQMFQTIKLFAGRTPYILKDIKGKIVPVKNDDSDPELLLA